MINIKLSVIIPVYQVENYIEKCLYSLFEQMNKNVECIIVNDGTPDQSMELVKKIIENYAGLNICVINQENQGLSAARNNGLKNAKGDYIAFLDSDDWIDNSYIEKILNIIDSSKLDIIHFNPIIVRGGSYSHESLFDELEGCLILDNKNKEFIFRKNKWFSCFRVFKKSLFIDKIFPLGEVFEDILTIPFLYKNGIKLYFIKDGLYFYYQRESSITNSKNHSKKIDSLMHGINIYKQYKCDSFNVIKLHLLILLIEYSLNFNYKKYRNFLNKNKVLMQEVRELQGVENIHWKKKLMLNHPILFFFYKNFFRFR